MERSSEGEDDGNDDVLSLSVCFARVQETPGNRGEQPWRCLWPCYVREKE